MRDSIRHGGDSLAPALLLRSQWLVDEGQYQKALVDLHEAYATFEEGNQTPESRITRQRIINGIAECEVNIGMAEKDAAQVEAGCIRFLGLDPGLRELSSGPIIYSARYLHQADAMNYRLLVRRVAHHIERHLRTVGLEGKSLRFAASHAASLLLLTADIETGPVTHEAAYKLQRLAIEALPDRAAAELYGHAGATALALGKHYLRSTTDELGRGFLEDATSLLESAIEQAQLGNCSLSFSQMVAHSKAGEAYVRLHSLSGLSTHADTAIHHLETSRNLGNAAPELIGMLADVFFRRGRRTASAQDLSNAITLKEEAKDAGNTSRENRSVLCAAHVALWQITGDANNLSNAIEAACDAIDADGTWPWPVFQLV